MARRGQMSWSQLRVGLFVLAGLALVVAGVFYITGSGVLGAKYGLVTYLPEVEGLNIGAPVTLDGIQVGNVDKIRIATPKPGEPPDASRSIEVIFRVSRNFQQYIRSDSNASLITQGFLGDRLVTLQRGFTGRILQDGDEVTGKEEKAIKQIVERGADLMQNLNVLSTQISAIVEHVEKGQGTIGKLLVDEGLYQRLNATVSRVDKMISSVQEGQGTIGKLMTSDALYGRIDSITGRVDDVLSAIQQQKGSLGKMVYDPSLHDSATRFLASGNAVIGDVRAGRGTIGKLATDDSLFTAMKETGQNLRDVTGKMNSNNSSAGKLLTDPQLYDNLVGLTGDVRLLMGEFRKNPKKFLRVRFSIF